MWFWGKTRNNYAVVDVGWGLVIAGISTIFILNSCASTLAMLALLIPIWLWAIRLSGFLYLTRIRTNHPEDKRYADFRKDYGDQIHQKFFTNVFLLQGFLALLLSGPSIALNSWNLQLNTDFISLIFPMMGLMLFLIGIIGESIADKQLHRFVSKGSNKGKVCNIGLWRYTRHPNYFFEWVLWLGIGFIPLRDIPSMISLLSPVIMFILLRYVSGVPFAERYSLKSKGQLFVDYQHTTNAFFPWFPKPSNSSNN
jgi:steroid 5-alpha reductase family enzyme